MINVINIKTNVWKRCAEDDYVFGWHHVKSLYFIVCFRFICSLYSDKVCVYKYTLSQTTFLPCGYEPVAMVSFGSWNVLLAPCSCPRRVLMYVTWRNSRDSESNKLKTVYALFAWWLVKARQKYRTDIELLTNWRWSSIFTCQTYDGHYVVSLLAHAQLLQLPVPVALELDISGWHLLIQHTVGLHCGPTVDC